jgi:nicotinamidase-related amidase
MEKKPSWQKELDKLKPGKSAFRFTEFPLYPKETALIIIDMQYKGAHPDYGVGLTLKDRFSQAEVDYYFGRLAETVVPNQVKLLDFFRSNGFRVIYVTSGVMLPDGSDRSPTKLKKSYPHIADFEYKIIEEIQPQPDELIIRKITHSAFTSTGIDQTLRNMGITSLVIAGIGTNVCVETTARDAADRGYRCIMVDDACATFTQKMHDYTLLAFALWFGKVQSTDEVIDELEREIQNQP